MNKKLRLFLIGILVTSFILLLFINNNAPKKVIKDSIKYQNEHNIDKLGNCYTDRKGIPYKTFKNIKSKKLISINLVTDQSPYDLYFNNGIEKNPNLTKDKVKIYKVKYNVQYKDDRKSPEDSGEYIKYYIVIKESDTEGWKIDSIGQ